MPVKVIVTSQKFFNEFKNGEDFLTDPTDYTNNLTGSVMENQMVSMTLDVSYNAQSSQANMFKVVGTVYTRSTGLWSDDGLASGDAITVEYYDSAGTFYGQFAKTIVSISGNTMVVDTTTSISDGNYSRMTIIGKEPITALIHGYSLRENQDVFGVQNLITGSDAAYYGSGMVAGGAWVNFVGLGQNKDWEDGSFRARKLAGTLTNQLFEIEHKLVIPFYSEGDDLNFLPNYLDGLKSLKYVFESDFRTVISNQNTSKKGVYDTQLGGVAGYNENFNGFDNNYSIKSVSYNDAASLSNADGILIAGKTKVTIIVEKILGSFVASERYGVYVGYKAEQSDYQNTNLSDFKENFIYDRSMNNEGAAAAVGDVFITNNTSIINGLGDLEITFDVEYDLATKLFLSNQFQNTVTEFVIGVNVGDVTIASGNSDRVMLLAANTVYDQSPDIEGLMNFKKFNIYPHDRQIGVGVASTNMTSWNEDGIVLDFEFEIDLNLDAVVNSLDFKLVAQDPINGKIFELDSYTYPIAGSIISGGIQQFNIATTRGYILESTDQFNKVTINVGTNTAGVQKYNGVFAQKISWQDWIQNLDADTIFYDSAEPNDNLNYKSSNYSALNGYDIKLIASANLFGTNAFGVSGLTDYIFASPALTVYDYTLDGNVTPIWSGVIETFNVAATTNLGLAVLNGQNTLFRTTWTNSNGPVVSLADLQGINRIEETGQQGYAMTELSTINPPDIGQILIPSTGSQLDMYLSGGLVIMDCLIDGSLVGNGINYNFSSRIGYDAYTPSLNFQTNNSFEDDGLFTPSIVKVNVVGAWNLGDGSPIQNTNSISYGSYSSNAVKNVSVAIDDIAELTEIYLVDDQIYGTIDLTLFDSIIRYELNDNPDLTSITFPTSTALVNRLKAEYCDLTGTIDLSGLTNLGPIIHLHDNPNLTSVTNPTSPISTTSYFVHDCDLTGNLDVSGFSGLGGEFRVQGNSNLTSITNPTSSDSLNIYFAFDCDLTGTINLSTLSDLKTDLRLQNNANLTGVTLPTNANTFVRLWFESCNISFVDFTVLSAPTSVNSSSIKLQDNGMTSGNVDQTFIDLDASAVGGFTSRSINLGGTNAAATATSLVARNSLVSKGFTLTYN